jgi:hypothetical protein
MPHTRLYSIPNASIRFQTDNKRFQTAIFLGLGDLFCNFALRGGADTAPRKIEFQGQLGSNLLDFIIHIFINQL